MSSLDFCESEEPAAKKPRLSLQEESAPTSENDPLCGIIQAIKDGTKLTKFESMVKLGGQSSNSYKDFTDRLLMKEVPEGLGSPLVEAVQSNRSDIVEFILKSFPVNIEQEAICMVSNSIGVSSPVMATALWAACYCGSIECVKLLVANGADLEHKCGSPKVTPLWKAVTTGFGDSDVVNLLLENNAKVSQTHEDETRSVVVWAIYQCEKRELVELLLKKVANSPRELYDCHCIRAAKIMQDDSAASGSRAASFIQKAVDLRLAHPALFSDLPPANEIYDGIQEPATMTDYLTTTQSETMMLFVCSIYCERILGREFTETMFAIHDCINDLLKHGVYDKCIQFSLRYLEIGLSPSIFMWDCFTIHLLNVVSFLAEMVKNDYVPHIQPFFEICLKAQRIEGQANYGHLISSIVRLVALWIKVADQCITDSTEQCKERSLIRKSIQDMMNLTEAENVISNALFDVYPDSLTVPKLDLPVEKVLDLLIEFGTRCPINRYNKQMGEFPLHLAVKLKDTAAVDCVRTLLEYGAHIDALNYRNQTVKDLLHSSSGIQDSVKDEMLEEIESFESVPPTLQCLTAHAIIQYNIEYKEHLPVCLAEFVSWHNKRLSMY